MYGDLMGSVTWHMVRSNFTRIRISLDTHVGTFSDGSTVLANIIDLLGR